MTYEELIKNLEAAIGPNYALEVEIFKLVHPEYADFIQGRGGLIHPQDGEDVRVQSNVRPPNYTASFDAALRLMQTLLPGWGGLFSFGSGDSIHRADIWSERRGNQSTEDDEENPLVGEDADGEHACAAIALCIAILKAKQAQEVAA